MRMGLYVTMQHTHVRVRICECIWRPHATLSLMYCAFLALLAHTWSEFASLVHRNGFLSPTRSMDTSHVSILFSHRRHMLSRFLQRIVYMCTTQCIIDQDVYADMLFVLEVCFVCCREDRRREYSRDDDENTKERENFDIFSLLVRIFLEHNVSWHVRMCVFIIELYSLITECCICREDILDSLPHSVHLPLSLSLSLSLSLCLHSLF